MVNIKKILFIIVLTLFSLTLNVKAISTPYLDSNNYSREAISVFEEYNNSVQKLDIILLIVAPLTITGVGLFYYIKKTRNL